MTRITTVPAAPYVLLLRLLVQILLFFLLFSTSFSCHAAATATPIASPTTPTPTPPSSSYYDDGGFLASSSTTTPATNTTTTTTTAAATMSGTAPTRPHCCCYYDCDWDCDSTATTTTASSTTSATATATAPAPAPATAASTATATGATTTLVGCPLLLLLVPPSFYGACLSVTATPTIINTTADNSNRHQHRPQNIQAFSSNQQTNFKHHPGPSLHSNPINHVTIKPIKSIKQERIKHASNQSTVNEANQHNRRYPTVQASMICTVITTKAISLNYCRNAEYIIVTIMVLASSVTVAVTDIITMKLAIIVTRS